MEMRRWLGVSMVLWAAGCAATRVELRGADHRPHALEPEGPARPPATIAPAPKPPANAPPAARSDALHEPGSISAFRDTGLVEMNSTSDLAGGTQSSTTVRWERDATGRVSAITRDGVRTLFAWDYRGRLVSESTSTGGFTGSETIYAYDAEGRLARACVTVDVGMLAVEPSNSCVRYEYDARGRVIRETTSSFSSREEPADPPRAVVDVRYTEDDAGRVLTEERYQNGRAGSVRRYVRDDAGRVIEETLDALHTPEVEDRRTFVYGPSGDVVSMTRVQAGTSGFGEAHFRYEGGRLVDAEGYLPEFAYAYTEHTVARFTYR